jgi:threonine dehydrogenase-like Zn-dependent dehydrogenase
MKKMYGQKDAGFFGYSHFTGGFPGGQAEYVRVPKGNVNLLPIPDEVPDEAALYLSDILPTAYHAVVDTGVHEGDVVGVWGLGPIGECVVRWAQIKGAKRIIGIDAVPHRLQWAREKLGIEVINFKETSDVPAEILKLVPNGLDVAIDCGTFHEPKTLLHKAQKALMLETDVPETANEMIVSVRKMGRVGLIAAYSAFTNGSTLVRLWRRECALSVTDRRRFTCTGRRSSTSTSVAASLTPNLLYRTVYHSRTWLNSTLPLMRARAT